MNGEKKIVEKSLKEFFTQEELDEIQFYHEGNEELQSLTMRLWDDLEYRLENKMYFETREQAVDSISQVELYDLSENPDDEKMEKRAEFLKQIGLDRIKKGLVNFITFTSKQVAITFGKDNILGLHPGNYYIPEQLFKMIIDRLPIDKRENLILNVFRGQNYASWFENTALKGHYLPLPIAINENEFDEYYQAIANNQLSSKGLDYLKNIPQEERLESYRNGTVAHEIGHSWFYYFLFETELFENWKKIVEKTKFSTNYAEKVKNRNSTQYYNELFAEAVRIYFTDKSYFSAIKCEEVNDFVE